MKSPYTDSLAHTTYECKYHIVFSPKYRRKEINGNLRTEIGMILRKLSNWKDVEISNAATCPNHYSYVCKYTTQIECVIIHRIFEIKKYINNIWVTC